MKSSLDLKKCETKLSSVCRSIGLKEAEKIRLDNEYSKLKNEIGPLHNLIKKTNNVRNEIKEELGSIRHQVEKKHDEMNRTKANLLYNSKREYEEMIRRLENEMQFNHRSFSSREETRILNEITSLTHGITLIESYEKQKHSYDNLKASLTAKKNEQEEIWNQVTEYKKKYHSMNDSIKELSKEIQQVNTELDELRSTKVDLKKQIEDLSREQVKQQQLKRHNLEKLKIDKQLRKDQLIISFEDDMRDYNKLINYFHKLINGKDDSQDTDQKLNTSQSFMSNSFASGCGGYQSCSESSSLASSTNSVQFSQANVLNDLKNQLSLGLSKVTLSPTNNRNSLTSNELITPLPSPCLSTNSSLNTPSNDDHPPFFCAHGSYMIKKKINETNNQNRRNRKSKKNQKNAKISHSVEVINLLSKLQIPIHLSSQFEECLNELKVRKDKLIHEMNTYKLNLELEKDQLKRQEEEKLKKNLSNSPGNNSNIFSDTYSDISSCLDSNYESDNNSVRSFQSSLFLNASNNKDNIGLPTTDQLHNKPDENKELLDRLGSEISMASTITNSSNGPTNSDDSDVTINESTLNEKELKILSAQMKKNEQINETYNTTSLPQQHQQQTSNNSLIRTKSTPDQNFKSNDADKLETKNNFNFFRQVSDGYSSSCTPLSASSITNEQPHVNPFFLGLTQTASATPGIIKTNDPVETAFLNTKNLNK